MGDAAVDVGESLRDASCALAQDDGGACALEEHTHDIHGSIDVVCDQVAVWTSPVSPNEITTYYALIDVPTRNVQIEGCRDGECGDACGGAPPPTTTCSLRTASFVGEQVYVECGELNAPTRTRVIW